MYLHMNPGMACVWFGSLVALDAFHPDDDSGKFQITHPSLLPVIEECIDAIIELGNRRRWDIRLVVAQILGAFPTQLRHQIMQAFDLEPPVAQGQE